MKNVLKILTYLCRFLVGAVFVYSGFVKLVDPTGTKIKMTEYFAADVLNMEFLIPYALPISLLLILAELVLGVMLIVGYKPKLAVWSTFALTLVFLFLTWYSFKYNKVTDCGCFGDAVKLTTEETFYKNVVFIGMLIVVLLGLRYVKPLFNERITLMIPYAVIGISGAIAFYCLSHLPIIDFRAYAIGNDIGVGVKPKKPKKQVVGKISTILVDYLNGMDLQYQAYMLTASDEDLSPPMKDFRIENESGNQVDKIISSEKSIFIVINNIKEADVEQILSVYNNAVKKGYFTVVASSEDLSEIKSLSSLNSGFCDPKALKTLIRSDVGVVSVKKGVILAKWNINDTDDLKY